MRIKILESAKEDLMEGFYFYESQAKGIGTYFLDSLFNEEFARLREWFYERDLKRWDREIESDSRSGKLDFLVKEALFEKAEGK